ncbi:MAG TPA: hypothetical protein PJ991_09395 [Kiritimatiellia bacterium]|nr:hypothetical protein [Kiritimatiellia bacterium]
MHASTTSITIVREPITHPGGSLKVVAVPADRWQLAKLRWRATATDGREFGFDLSKPLRHQDVICANDYSIYVVEQLPEPVVVFERNDDHDACALAWSIGNLHQPLQVTRDELIAPDDPALRQITEQFDVKHRSEIRVFQPIRNTVRHTHGHHHHHH